MQQNDWIENKRAVIMARASDKKQTVIGDTLNAQVNQCKTFLKKHNCTLVKTFQLIETGSDKERAFFEEVIAYCENPKNKVEVLTTINLGRFTRGGPLIYQLTKSRFEKAGVKVVDTQMLIQPEKNTLEDLDFYYDWSRYNPSERVELWEAERYKEERREILTRTIGAQIRYTQLGYAARRAPLGLQNKKASTQHGIRSIQVLHPTEGPYIRKMFEQRAEGRSFVEISNWLKSQGFTSRKYNRWNRRTGKIIGESGGISLSPKQVQRIIENPRYSGVISEFWTHNRPIKAPWEAPIPIELFNKANKNRFFIEDSVFGVKIYSLKGKKSKAQRLRKNPEFPYKEYVLCPICGKPLLGSASTSKSGKKHPAYHCARGHERFSVKRKVLHDLVEDTVKRFRFRDDFVKLFVNLSLAAFRQKRSWILSDMAEYEEKILDITKEQEQTAKLLSKVTSDATIKQLDNQIAELEAQKLCLKKEKMKVDKESFDVEIAIGYAAYIMEHPDDLLIESENPLDNGPYFGSFFEETPTFNDLVFGTLKLKPIVRLIDEQDTSKSQLVTLRGIEPRLPG